MNTSEVYGQYSLLLWAADHHRDWKRNEQGYYRENPGFPAMYEDFGTYQDHLDSELKAAKAAIDKLEASNSELERLLND